MVGWRGKKQYNLCPEFVATDRLRETGVKDLVEVGFPVSSHGIGREGENRALKT